MNLELRAERLSDAFLQNGGGEKKAVYVAVYQFSALINYRFRPPNAAFIYNNENRLIYAGPLIRAKRPMKTKNGSEQEIDMDIIRAIAHQIPREKPYVQFEHVMELTGTTNIFADWRGEMRLFGKLTYSRMPQKR